ncbi:MAG TPA: DNA polymerase III subunit gamma/tau [Burkholderiales bacterium]|nr:DNA polymerase III subunit gamma/tau [Burkholderiales bacterium]
MSYQVLARKWRPRNFSELVGQQHVVQPLVNALDHGRLHHAFLFTGTRGVGKTTIARILAKSLNCETGVTSKPCGQCSACQEVDEGRFVDLIEVDAASRTKVDDTRELLDNVQYAPSRGRYKVYLIDEVHMLSGHSFNALLKTLEEPPPHVKFLLATTDPQRLPVTVLSRCLQFSLKRLSVEEISDQLEKILAAENVEHDAPSVRLLARGADGSMRDGLSLLDQAIAFGGGRVVESDVRTMLGTIDQDVIERLLKGLAAGDAPALLQVVAQVHDHGTDCAMLLDDLLLALHHVALIQTDPALVDEMVVERLQSHAAALSPQDVQLYYQIGLLGRRDLPLAPDPRVGVEMTLLRMLAFRPETANEAVAPRAGAKVSPSSTKTTTSAPVVHSMVPPEVRRPATAATSVSGTSPNDNAAAASPAGLRPTPSRSSSEEGTGWAEIVDRLPVNGLVKELLNNTALERVDDKAISLVLDEACAKLLSKEREAVLRQALEAHYGRPLRLTVRVGAPPAATPMRQKMRQRSEEQQAAVAAIDGDPNVRALREQFNARVNPDSIRPAGTTEVGRGDREHT